MPSERDLSLEQNSSDSGLEEMEEKARTSPVEAVPKERPISSSPQEKKSDFASRKEDLNLWPCVHNYGALLK
jgi:hypothetical protein